VFSECAIFLDFDSKIKSFERLAVRSHFTEWEQCMPGKYRWAQVGDINSFFGLMLDNIAGLFLLVSLLNQTFGFPVEFALRYMVPGTAIGVLIGDLAFFLLALQLAKRTGSTTVTAMPLGLDTPSTFGMVFFVLGPAYASAVQAGMESNAAAMQAWQIGICCIFVSGLFKFACSLGSDWLRRSIPRAGLLGSLAAIALVIISFLPLLEILHYPMVGLIAMAIILTALVGRVPLPFKLPGAVGGLVVAGGIYAIMHTAGLLGPGEPLAFDPADGLWPTEWLQALSFGWLSAMGATLNYLPIVIPFAVVTVVGGIDCAESASAVGDHYSTRSVIGIEALATLLGSFCGAVIQTTPYIGHPAYKAMGGRAAFTLATAIGMGLLGTTGLFGYFYLFIPKAAVYPILMFVGLEISAQSFLATPRRHYPAVAMACVPALAFLAMFFVGPTTPVTPAIETTGILRNGFILTSVFWSSALALVIDRRLSAAAVFYFVAAACTVFGVIHSPLPSAPLLLPFAIPGVPESLTLPAKYFWTVMNWTAGYFIVGCLMLLWDYYLKVTQQTAPDPDHPQD
jgi:AGZA family xanthine/uracil permease-like MFS transporter